MWHPFRHKQSEGSLPLLEWSGAAFPFQAGAGHNYDQWYWPYPAQTNQYTYFNAVVGNQLPNFSVSVQRGATAHPGAQLNRPWVTSTNRQQQNALQSQVSGIGPLQWPQQSAADYIARLGQQWNAGGGRLKKSMKLRGGQ